MAKRFYTNSLHLQPGNLWFNCLQPANSQLKCGTWTTTPAG